MTTPRWLPCRHPMLLLPCDRSELELLTLLQHDDAEGEEIIDEGSITLKMMLLSGFESATTIVRRPPSSGAVWRRRRRAASKVWRWTRLTSDQ